MVMAVYRYPPEVHEFVKKWAPKMRDQELAAKCNAELGTNFTTKSMKSFRGNHGYRNHQRQYSSEEYWKYQTKWPQGMFEFIRDNSWGVSSAKMAKMVNEKFGTNFTDHRMKNFRAKYGIRSGETGWFQKNHAPGNKGKKQSEYCTPEALERSRQTQFQEGHVPANQKPVGTISKTRDGYLIRKKSMTGSQWERWEVLHRAVWEEQNGPIPEGYAVCFRDGNRENCDISNLMLISRAERAIMGKKGYWSKNPELTETGLNLVRLQQKSKNRRMEK
jgi:hypothetical protein